MSPVTSLKRGGGAGRDQFVPNFIVDAPAERDEFDGREPLAATMATALIGDPRLKFVGVIGEWGSGKSTVVEMLRRRLQAHAEPMLCFTYDAWLHQSDPPRRAFLEALVRFVREDPDLAEVMADADAWEETLQALHRQVEVTEVITRPELALSAKVLLPTLVFVPLGVKLLGDGVLAQAAQRDPWSIAMFCLGWGLALLPVLVGAGLYLAWRPWGDKTAKGFWTRHRTGYANQSILSVFANKPAEFKHEQKSKGPEPSTIEFQDMFRKIVAAVQTKSRRLVIILDNLDRVPDADRLVLWSTIRSFFLGADHAGRPLERRALPTVIIPADTDALSRLGGGHAGDARSAEAFSDKTFDLVFHVPPPVLSKWRAYLCAKLEAVFGDHVQAAWHHTIPVLYENAARLARSGGSTVRITPRSLNVFVNAIATHWLQWRDLDIPLETIAYFVLAKVGDQDDLHGAVQAAQAQLEAFDPQWNLGLAALYYGVPKPQAEELFMEQPILDAIRLNDTESFTRLSTLPAFDRYLLEILQTAGNGGNLGADPQAAARLLDGLAGVEAQATWRDHAWRLIRRALPVAIRGRTLDAEAIALTFKSASEPARQVLLGEVRGALSELQEVEVRPQLEAYRKVILVMQGQAQAMGLAVTPVMATSIPLFLDLLDDPGLEQACDWIDTKIASDQIVAQLARTFAGADQISDRSRAISALARREGRVFDWDPLLSSLNTGLRNHQSAWAAQCVKAWWSLIQARPTMIQLFLPVINDGALRNGLEILWRGEEQEAFIKAAALSIAQRGMLPDLSWDQVLRQEPELGVAIAEHLKAFADLEILEFQVRSNLWARERLIVRAIFTAWVEGRTLAPDEIDVVLDHWATYEDLLEENTRHRFWHRLNGMEGFHSALQRRDLEDVRGIAARVRAYEVEQGGGGDPKDAIARTVQHALAAVPEHAWASAVENGGDAYAFLEERPETVFPEALKQSLIGQAPRVLVSGNEQHRSRWFHLANRADAEQRAAMMRALKDAVALGSMPHDPATLVALGGTPLMDALALPTGEGSFLDAIVILLAQNFPGLIQLELHRHTVTNAILAAPLDQRQRLAATLDSLGDPSNESVQTLTWMRAALGEA